MPGLLYVDDLALCSGSKEELKVMVSRFVEVCRRGLKINAEKSKVIVLGGYEELGGEFCVDTTR